MTLEIFMTLVILTAVGVGLATLVGGDSIFRDVVGGRRSNGAESMIFLLGVTFMLPFLAII